MDKQIEKLDLALEVIEKEASALQALGNYATEDKLNMTKDLGNMFDQILGWLNQMEGSFNQVDQQTSVMYDSIQNIGINEKMDELITHSQEVQAKLLSIFRKSKMATQNNPLKEMKEEEFGGWLEKINELSKQDKEKVIDGADGIRMIGLGLLGVVAGVILGAFAYMYFKIRRQINNKRII